MILQGLSWFWSTKRRILSASRARRRTGPRRRLLLEPLEDRWVLSSFVQSGDVLYENNVPIDRGVNSFAVAFSGTLYDLETNGHLWRLNSAGWLLIDYNSASISLSSWGGYGGSGWSSSGSYLYDLDTNGKLWQFTDSTGQWSFLSAGVSNEGSPPYFDGTYDASAVYLNTNGDLYLTESGPPGTGSGAERLVSHNVVSWAPQYGNYFGYNYLRNDGTLWYVGESSVPLQWIKPSSDTSAVLSYVAASNSVFALFASGNVFQSYDLGYLNSSAYASNVASLSGGASSSGLYYLKNDGTFWLGPSQLDTNVRSATVNVFAPEHDESSTTPTVTVYYVKNDNSLWEIAGPGAAPQRLDVNTSSISVGANNTLWELETSGNLWMLLDGAWTFMGQSASISSAANGTFWDLQANGNLWQWNRSGWIAFDGGVTSIQIEPNGTMYQFLTNQLWQWNFSGWVLLDSSAKSDAIATDGDLIELSSSGALSLFNSIGKSQLGSPSTFTSFSLLPGGYQISATLSGGGSQTFTV